MLKYCKKKADDDGDQEAILLLANEYKENNNNKLAIEYYEKSIIGGSNAGVCSLVTIYYRLKNYDAMHKYATIALETNNYDEPMLLSLVNYYLEDDNCHDNDNKIVELCELAIEKGGFQFLHKLSSYYESKKEYGKMVDCYVKGIIIEENCDKVITESERSPEESFRNKLNNYFRKKDDPQNMVRVKPYLDAENMQELNKWIRFHKLLKNTDFTSFVDECCVCLDDKYQSYFPCGHGVCIECFSDIKKTCPYCRKPIHPEDVGDADDSDDSDDDDSDDSDDYSENY